MKTSEFSKIRTSGVGYFINSVQTLFVGLLRIWTIPIVLMLSVASGFTTYYGLSHFITPWIALIITIAIQSIIVICSLEIAGMHWQANRFRYFSVVCSLLVALTASVSFSYFKFYEISQKDTLHINRLNQIRTDVKSYVDRVLVIKGEVLKQQRADMEKATLDVQQAYFGTHAQIVDGYKHQVGEGPFWKHYNQIYQEKKQQQAKFEQDFSELDKDIQKLQVSINALDVTTNIESAYSAMLENFQNVQLKINLLSGNIGQSLPEAPLLMTYKQFTADVQPSFAMWSDFSLFAFLCAAMVEFFTVLLSYRLEFTAPGPLTAEEEDLVFECLRQFTEFRINKNDELEMTIEKSEIERARRYSDWSRMFAVGLLLSRGFLRKIDDKTVEFAPNLYPLIAEKMSDKINKLKAESNIARQAGADE
ncbi:MAG: hypothetical protein M0R41_13860 [Methylobacter tundripaludum]|uniref:Uncharacterized protein n=1 Tax=Methylobacter tundripaludum TaxID=173365 RepID=A0A2S6GJU3_9GAMM|nr:hypothetical protein [Methylobacter tundripaludum]MCK9637358.1 hypothetical protein [Methylobacter tundripaludum]PPK65502.1 hypothetical protein B0F88_12014 [Methylobacter tundripaludum]